MRYRRTLGEDEKEKFAYELALGYYTTDELRHVFKLLPEAHNNYLESEQIQVMVTQQKRKIDESDSALRIHARKAARVAIDELSKLVKDEDAPAKTRMEAGRQLREYAFAADKNALQGGGDDGDGAIYLRTNLNMGEDSRGIYRVEAKPIDDDELEDETEDDFSDLIGL